jgi:rubrerythrin
MMAAGLAEIPLAIAFKVMNDRRRRRPTLGLCARCGYDLRGSPGRCPECGDVTVPLSPWP